jgi:hypothetical protein
VSFALRIPSLIAILEPYPISQLSRLVGRTLKSPLTDEASRNAWAELFNGTL